METEGTSVTPGMDQPGTSDGQKVRESFTADQQPEQPKRKLTAAQRKENARRASQARWAKARGAVYLQPGAAEAVAGPSEESKLFWGLQAAALWNQAAHERGWPMMPGAPIDPDTGMLRAPADPAVFLPRLGEPVAKMMDQLLPEIDKRPWLQVLLIMAPFIGGAGRVEYRRYLQRRTGAGGGERGGVRPQGSREEQPAAEPDLVEEGTPITT